MKRRAYILLFIGVVFFPLGVSAASLLKPEWIGTTSVCDVFSLLKSVINYTFSLLVPLFILLMIIGGIYHMVGGYDKKNLEKSNKVIKSAIIGFIIVLLAWSMVTVTIGLLGFTDLTSGAGAWWNLECPGTETETYDWPADDEFGNSTDPCGGINGPAPSGSCTMQVQTASCGTMTVACDVNPGGNQACICNQQSQMSGALTNGLECMAEFLASNYDESSPLSPISGIGDSGSAGMCYEECASAACDSSKCNHGCGTNGGPRSAHYGCGSVSGQSYAVDLGDETKEDMYVEAARFCGAATIVGPHVGTAEEKAGHQDHVHISFGDSATDDDY